jgi:hypothetical protein
VVGLESDDLDDPEPELSESEIELEREERLAPT